MSDDPKEDQEFTDQEAQERFKQALRGARQAAHKPMKQLPKKRAESQRKDKPRPPRKDRG